MESKKRTLLLISALFLFLNHTFSQVDSLRQLIATTYGKEKMVNMLELSFILAKEPASAREGIDLAQQAISIAESLSNDDPEKLRRLFWGKENTALAAIRLGEFDQAHLAASEMLTLAQTMPDSLGISRTARSFLQLGEIYYWQGQYTKQVAMLQKAVDIFEKTSHKDDWAVALNNLGNAYDQLEKYDSALLCLRACDPVFESWGGGMDLPNKVNMALVMQKKGNWEEADLVLDEVFEKAPKEGFPSIAYAYTAKGESLLRKKDFNAALNLYRMAEKYVKDLHEPDARAGFYQKYAAAFEETGQLDSAIFYFKKYKAIEDSLQNELFDKNLIEAQTQLEVNEKLASLERRMQRSGNVQLLGLAAAFLIFLAGIYWFFQQKKKKEIAAAARSLTIHLQPVEEVEAKQADTFIEQFLSIVQKELSNEKLSVEGIAQTMRISRVQLFKKVKNATGASPSEIIRQYRLEAGKKLLLEKKLTVSEIAYRVGFSNPNSFGRAFKDRFGSSPTEFLKM